MDGSWIKREGNPKLLVVVMGWSCDEHMLERFDIEGRDIYATYNYTDMETSNILTDCDFSVYERIELLAWSFGVWAAESVARLLPRVDMAIALNGTPKPVDNRYGIHERSFKITVWAVDQMGLEKFNERMVGEYKEDFIPAQRDIADQTNELKMLSDHFKGAAEPTIKWDVAVVGSLDNIIPPENMSRYWQEAGTEVISKEIYHYPFTKDMIECIGSLLNR